MGSSHSKQSTASSARASQRPTKVFTSKEDNKGMFDMHIIIITVGGLKSSYRDFFLHKDLLVIRSSFFKNALKFHGHENGIYGSTICGNDPFFKYYHDGVDGCERLPTKSVETFAYYTQLLYRDKLPIKEAIGDRKGAWTEVTTILDVYMLAHFWEDKTAKKLLLTAFSESILRQPSSTRAFPDSKVIKVVYKRLPLGAPMRMLVADTFMLSRPLGWVPDEDYEQTPQDFKTVVAQDLRTKTWRHRELRTIKRVKKYIDRL